MSSSRNEALIYRVVRACPSFLDLDDNLCRVLAGHAQLRAYDVAQIFAADQSHPQPLRILVRGSAFHYVQHSGRTVMRLLRPGSVVGFQCLDESVRHCARLPSLFIDALPVPMSTWHFVVEPEGPVQVVEIPATSAQGLFREGCISGDWHADSIAGCLLAAYARLAWLFQAMDAMTASSTLYGIRPSRIFDLLDRAQVELWSATNAKETHQRARDLHLVVEGTLVGTACDDPDLPATARLVKRAGSEIEPGLTDHRWLARPIDSLAVVLRWPHREWWPAMCGDLSCVAPEFLELDRVLLLRAPGMVRSTRNFGPRLAEELGELCNRPVDYRPIVPGDPVDGDRHAEAGPVPAIVVVDALAIDDRAQQRWLIETLRVRTVVYVMDDPSQWRDAPSFLLHPLYRPASGVRGPQSFGVGDGACHGQAALEKLDDLVPSRDVAPTLIPIALLPDCDALVAGMTREHYRSETAMLGRRARRWWATRRRQANERVGLEPAPPQYPVYAVRVFESHACGPEASDAAGSARRQEALARCARAVIGRRVAVVLGGGGALGYAHLALLRKMQSGTDGVPVDVVIGASTGTLMGTYYVVLGIERAIEFMRSFGWLYLPAMVYGYWSSFSYELLVDVTLGQRLQQHTEITILPVVTDAWQMRGAVSQLDTIGFGVRASGSYPPTGPTIYGSRRLLDGGVFWMDPVGMALSVDAVMVVSSSVFPGPDIRRAQAPLPIPVLGSVLSQFNPIDRFIDYQNTQFVAARRPEATVGAATATVQYVAQPVPGKSVTSWAAFQTIFEQAEQSQALLYCARQAKTIWARVCEPVRRDGRSQVP